MTQPISSDLLDGVPAIAAFLGWPERRVYSARESGQVCPIRKRPGIGIYAFRSELEAWLRDPEALPEAKRDR